MESIDKTKEQVAAQNGTSDMWQQRKQNAAHLASQYTATKRFGEYISVISFFSFVTYILYRLSGYTQTDYFVPIVIAASVLGMLLADLFSGLAHWGADTWGGLETPFVGKSFIRSFREHHVDPFRITQHDFVETNGDNCMLAAIPLGILAFSTIDAVPADIFKASFLTSLCIWVAATNQIHKWSHMLKPPGYVSFMQDWHIILDRKGHQLHHHNPFDRYYCITTGWLNPILGEIGFWKRLEQAVTLLTGAVPRADDAVWTVQFKASDLPPVSH